MLRKLNKIIKNHALPIKNWNADLAGLADISRFKK